MELQCRHLIHSTHYPNGEPFQWGPKGGYVTFVDSKTVVHAPVMPLEKKHDNHIVHLTCTYRNTLHPGKQYSTVVWEMTMHQPDEHPGQLNFFMGFWMDGVKRPIGIQVGGFVRKNANGKGYVEVYRGEYYKKERGFPALNRAHKHGDRYAIVFDFEENIVWFEWNGMRIFDLYEPDDTLRKVTPHLRLHTTYGCKAKVECTKWKVMC